MIMLTDKELSIVKNILSNFPYTFYAFGSRVKNNARPLSDLDLCYKDVIPDAVITKIHEAFELSNLPFTVDLLSWHRCEPAFQERIQKDFLQISP